MSKRHRYAVNKLVRDNTAKRLEKAGCIIKYRIMDDAEYRLELNKKLLEEAHEVIEAQDNKAELVTELADVLEIIHAVARMYGLSIEDVEKRRTELESTRGGFDQRIYSEYVEVDESTPQWSHYKDKPGKYPELEIK